MMLKAEATLEAACSNQPLLSFTSCTRSYFCCWLGSTSPRLPMQGPAGGSGPGMAGVAGGVPAAAGSQPPRCTSGGEKTAGSRGSGSHATVEQKLRGGKGSRARAARKQQRYANAVEKLTACKGASSASPSCSGAVSTEAFSVSLLPPAKYLILSEKPFQEVSVEFLISLEVAGLQGGKCYQENKAIRIKRKFIFISTKQACREKCIDVWFLVLELSSEITS